MAAGLTYNSLLSDMQAYAERNDTAFVNQLPRFIMLGENRIARECKNLGFVKVVTSSFLGGGAPAMVISKPARWRATLSWNFGTGTTVATANTRNNLFERSYEFCRNYWPDPTVQVTSAATQLRYYCDYDFNNWLIAGTPDQAWPYEINYYERVLPLDNTNGTNWLTDFAPDLIFYACMLEMVTYLKKFDLVAQWEPLYDRAKTAISTENTKRMMDRSELRTA